MRYSTASAMLMAAMIGQAVAGPTPGHAHLHQHAHEKKEVTQDAAFWNTAVDWNTVNYGGSSTAAPAPAVTSAAPSPIVAAQVSSVASPAAKPAASSAAPVVNAAVSSGSTDTGLLNGIVGVSNSRTTFGTASSSGAGCPGVSCINNYGNPYGSSIIKVSSTSGQTYTNTFTNTQKNSITVNIWNKVGADLQANSGQSSAPKSTTLTFVLAPGASQVVSFMENTSGGWAQATNKLQPYGAFDTTWGEFTFIKGGSAWDVSAIENSQGNNYNMVISSPGCTSNMDKNMWVTTQLNKDATGKNVAPNGDANCVDLGSSGVHLTTTLGGTV